MLSPIQHVLSVNKSRLIFLGKNDFVTCVQTAYPDIEPGTKLTRLQWSIVRRSLGKPRRCSPKFFEVKCEI